jgi:uncharacterized surface protein with fasciclin (FAS1) repeats
MADRRRPVGNDRRESMNKNLWRLLALVLSFGLVAAACGDDATVSDDAGSETSETTEAEGSSESGDAMDDEELPATVVDIATSNDDFSILVTALTEADLVSTLQGEGPFTVFAPTNAAFEALLAELDVTAEDLLAREDLGDILTYHVVPGMILAEDAIAAAGTEVASVNGDTIAVSLSDGSVMVDGATVVTPDLKANNGVVHVIDAVILPGS